MSEVLKYFDLLKPLIKQAYVEYGRVWLQKHVQDTSTPIDDAVFAFLDKEILALLS